MAHVFISYARSDIWAMRAVRYFLISVGFRTWADETGLRPGTADWRSALWAALDESGCVLTICTPSARKSKWVNDELERATELKKKLFALLVEGEPGTALPTPLKWNQYSDARQHFRVGVEELVEAIDGAPDVVNVRRTGAARERDSLRWDRVGSIFWFASEGRKIRLQLLAKDIELDEIIRGLHQLKHHAVRLNANRFAVREIELILRDAERSKEEGFDLSKRTWHSDRLRVAFDTVARLAEDADSDFEPGPRWV
jgi:hypothetical protein